MLILSLPHTSIHLLRFDYGYALVMEDIGGTVLTKLFDYKKQGLPLDIFLEIACKISTSAFLYSFPLLVIFLFCMQCLHCHSFLPFPLLSLTHSHRPSSLPAYFKLDLLCFILAKGLGAIHAAGVIHKDINPSNIVYCETTGALNIIDFGISSQLSKNEVITFFPPFFPLPQI